MIEFQEFVDTIDRWVDLTTMKPLSGTAKTRWYDQLRDYPEDAFKDSVDRLIYEGALPGYRVLENKLQDTIRRKKKALEASRETIYYDKCPFNRSCSVCDADGCGELDRECKIFIPMIMDESTHEKAKEELEARFPELTWFPQKEKTTGVLRKKDGSFILIKEKVGIIEDGSGNLYGDTETV